MMIKAVCMVCAMVKGSSTRYFPHIHGCDRKQKRGVLENCWKMKVIAG